MERIMSSYLNEPIVEIATEPPSQGLWSTLREAVRGSSIDYTSAPLGRAILMLAVPMVLEMAMESIFAVADVGAGVPDHPRRPRRSSGAGDRVFDPGGRQRGSLSSRTMETDENLMLRPRLAASSRCVRTDESGDQGRIRFVRISSSRFLRYSSYSFFSAGSFGVP